MFFSFPRERKFSFFSLLSLRERKEIVMFFSFPKIFREREIEGNFPYFPCDFLPTLPSSTQKSPCSFIRFLTVFSVTPIYSAIASTVTSPSIVHALYAVSMASFRSFLLSPGGFLFSAAFFHSGTSPSGSTSANTPILST